MKNKAVKNIAQESCILSDDELKSVVGGQWVEFGAFGSTNPSVSKGPKVKVVDGSTCPTCGGVTGHLVVCADGHLCVQCEKCEAVILENHHSGAIEII